jgi:hypothetical protein
MYTSRYALLMGHDPKDHELHVVAQNSLTNAAMAKAAFIERVIRAHATKRKRPQAFLSQ